MNKEIRRFKLAVNSACPLRCDYCLLDKDAGEVLDLDSARRALDLFLGSPGSAKKLLLYGGEPMLEFARIREIIAYGEEASRRLGKRFSASIATSGVVLRAQDLRFMREHRMTLSISIDGSAESHDRFRRYLDGRPSFQRIRENLQLVFDILGKERATAIMCVHPANAKRTLEDFRNLVSLGFEHVNIEVVHGLPWKPEAVADFRRGIEAIGEDIHAAISQGSFIFLEGFAIVLQREPQEEKLCPFHSCLEVFPSGDYSLYPFPFIKGLPERGLASIGTVAGGLIDRFADCSFDRDGERCRSCRSDYYSHPAIAQGNEPYEYCMQRTEDWITKILLRAKSEPVLRRYVQEAVARAAMGYR